MRQKNHLQALSPLLGKPVFTAQEARALGISSSVLCHYVKTGDLIRIRRGVYQHANYKSPAPFQWEDLIQAVHSIPDGAICLISALAIYDLTEEIPRQHWIGIRHGTSVKEDREIKIVRFRNFDLGKTQVDLDGVSIPIFDRERTLIDAFRLLSRETAIKALKAALAIGGKDRLDQIKLQEYAKVLRFEIAPFLMSLST